MKVQIYLSALEDVAGVCDAGADLIGTVVDEGGRMRGGVDSFSQTNVAGRRDRKDLVKVRAFVANAKAAVR